MPVFSIDIHARTVLRTVDERRKKLFGVLFCEGFVVAFAAERLVDVFLTEDDEFLAGGQAVAVVGEVAAADTDRVDFLDIFRNGHETRYGTERLAEIVGVESGDDDTNAAVGERLADLNEAFIEKLRFIDADDLHVRRDVQHPGGRPDRRTGNGRGVMGNDIQVGVTFVDGRLENLDFLFGELGAFETTDQFLGLAGEHGTADDFDAARFFGIF